MTVESELPNKLWYSVYPNEGSPNSEDQSLLLAPTINPVTSTTTGHPNKTLLGPHESGYKA